MDIVIYHVYPEGDLREHSVDSEEVCWCRPEIETIGWAKIYVHNSLDGREFTEGDRTLH